MIHAGLNHCENGTMHTPGLHTHKVTYEKATGEKALAEKGFLEYLLILNQIKRICVYLGPSELGFTVLCELVSSLLL